MSQQERSATAGLEDNKNLRKEERALELLRSATEVSAATLEMSDPPADLSVSASQEQTAVGPARELNESEVPAAVGEVQENAVGEQQELTAAERQELCARGHKAFLAGRLDIAIDCLERGLPPEGEWEFRFCLAMGYVKKGLHEKALLMLNHIIDSCQEQSIVAKARQARNNVDFALVAPEPSSDVQAMPAPVPRPTVAAPVAVKISETRVEKPASTQSKTGGGGWRVALFIAVVVVALYYGAALTLPSVYCANLFSVAGNGSVASLGELDDVKPQSVTIPAAHYTKLAGCYYEKGKAPMVLVIHPTGMANDLGLRKSLAEAALHAGYSVFLYDTGNAEKYRSWDGFIDDGLFVRDYLHGLGYLDNTMVHYGCALSCATVGHMTKKTASMILENPFRSIPSLVKSKYPWMQIFPDSFFPERHSSLLTELAEHPRLMIVQTQNPVVPASETAAFVKLASEPKSIETSSSDVRSPHWTGLIKFLGSAESAGADSSSNEGATTEATSKQ